jgi:hypothetical protein
MQQPRFHLHLLQAACTAALALGGLGSAQAQQVGTYVGSTSDGHYAEVDVSYDGSSYYVSGVWFYGTMNCAKTGETQEWGLGWGGYLFAIANDGSAGGNLVANTEYIGAQMSFSGNGVKGKWQGSVPVYAGLEVLPPKKTQVCGSGKLSFQGTLQAQVAARPAVANQIRMQR